jgi:ribose 1,5-bisphosphate isomerase
MLAKTRKTLKKIKNLKIQGAWGIALAGVKALADEMNASDAEDRKEFLKQMLDTIMVFKRVRDTEPALRNALRFIFANARKSRERDVDELKRLVSREAKDYEQNSLRVKLKIAEYGARLIPHGANVLIHCHSSTLMRVLKRAHDEGKKPVVFCTETRPLYQGRISAKELSDYGIKTRLVVDSASGYALRQLRDTDLVMVGADAITSEGDLVNKVGTSLIALAAHHYDKKLYSCTGTHKFDPLTLWGVPEPIEQRPWQEVLSAKEEKELKMRKKNFCVLNPAFDLTDSEHVSAYVTEIGVIPPQGLLSAVWKEFNLSEEETF